VVHHLVAVDVAKGHVGHPGVDEQRPRQHQILAQGHHPFGADLRAIEAAVEGDDARPLRIEGPRLLLDESFQAPAHLVLDVSKRGAPQLLAAEQHLPRDPGDGEDPRRAGAGGHLVEPRAVGNGHALDLQGAKDLHRVGPARRRRDVVVAGQDKHRHIRRPQALHPAGELALVGRVRRAVLVDIPGDEHQIDPGLQAEIQRLVQALEVIDQTAVHAGARIEAPVVLDADVQIGKVQDLHTCRPYARATPHRG
jgi:hypothetical protein